MTPADIALEIERSDARSVMGTPEGRRWVWALLESCDVWGEAPTDPIEQNRHAGRRDVGIAVMRRLQRLLPGEYNLMVQEAAKEALPEPLVSMAAEPTPADPAASIEGFELPEGFDPVAGETLKGLAGQLGLDGAKAKVLLETYSKAQVAAQEKAEADFVAQAKAFTAQAAEHPVVKELGGVQKARVLAGKALSAFGSKGLSEALTASGLAYHPEVLAFVARIGAKLGDDSVAGGSSSAAAPTSQRAALKAIYNHPTSSSMFPKE